MKSSVEPTRPRSRGAVLWPWLLVAWTGFVWIGRIRNALGDPELANGGRTGPILLALSFLIPAVALAVALVVAQRGGRFSPVVSLVGALGLWTTALWLVRAVDIAVGGDHSAAFIAVHVVLAVVSIGISAAAFRAVFRAQ